MVNLNSLTSRFILFSLILVIGLSFWLYKTPKKDVTAEVLQTGLVGWWKLDDNAGIGAIDSSTNSNVGTLNNMDDEDWITGKIGNALDFDGSDDRVEIPDNAALQPGNESWTVSAWAKPTDGDELEVMVGKRETSDPFEQWILGICGNTACSASGQQLTFFFREDSGVTERIALGASDVRDGNWHHYVGIADKAADIIVLYFDGVEETISDTADNGVWPTVNNTDPMWIGDAFDGVAPFTGSVDDVRLYNRVLTSDEVRILYEEGLRNGRHSAAILSPGIF